MENTIVKIAEYKVRQYGDRGVEISIPAVFKSDNNIEFGDTVEIHRGTIEGRDALIIFPKPAEVLEETIK